MFPELYETMGHATEMHYKDFFFPQETEPSFNRNALGQLCLGYGLISLLVLQLRPSQFSPWFRSDPTASRYTLVGLAWQ